MISSQFDSFILKFPQDSGFDNTEINFLTGQPDLKKLFFEEYTSTCPRLFVTDDTVINLDCMKSFADSFENGANGKDRLLVLGSGEKYKTIESVLKIVSTALDSDFNRNCTFIGIGGGVICDMTGFAASMFKRGVDCEFVPTTLLADVDASVGGKTGCDFSSYKNMIGAFYPAKKLWVYSSFVLTLPQKEFISGMAEAIKTAFLFNANTVDFLENNVSSILNKENPQNLDRLISECSRAKAFIVNEDPKEKGRRAYLNLGHTFGHALESIAGLGEVTHGEGVAWGMARAAELALKKGLCSQEYKDRCFKILESYGYSTEPIHPAVKNIPDVKNCLIKAMHKDKKNMNSNVRVTLQKDFENTVILEVTDEELNSVLE